MPSKPQATRQIVLDLLQANPHASVAQIVDATGMTRNAVIGQLYRAGIEISPSKRGAARKPVHALDQPIGCRFMIDNGDGCRDPNWRWCGKKEQPGSAYCPAHHARCYRRPEPESAAA